MTAYACKAVPGGWVLLAPHGTPISKAMPGEDGRRTVEALAEFAEFVRAQAWREYQRRGANGHPPQSVAFCIDKG